MPIRLTLYSKPRCGLCDEMKAVVREVAAELAVDVALEEIDITRDPALHARFRLDIPVLEVDGHRAFKHRVDKDALKARLERAAALPS